MEEFCRQGKFSSEIVQWTLPSKNILAFFPQSIVPLEETFQKLNAGNLRKIHHLENSLLNLGRAIREAPGTSSRELAGGLLSDASLIPEFTLFQIGVKCRQRWSTVAQGPLGAPLLLPNPPFYVCILISGVASFSYFSL